MRYKLIAFDLDGTLVKEISCWKTIHEHFNVQKDASKNLEAWKNEKIDFSEFMKRDIALWKPIPHISKIKEILSNYTLPPKACETLEKIRKRGYKTAIISGGLDVLAEMVAQELKIPHIFANSLKTNKKGYLNGEGIPRVDPRRKSETLEKLTKKLGIKKDQCIGVGNSIYDADLLSACGKGIIIGDDGAAADLADVVISDFKYFDQILDHI